MTGTWMCSICGSYRIQTGSVQPSLGDPDHPLGLCWDCRGKQPMPMARKDGPADAKPVRHWLSPLCRPEEFAAKQRRAPTAMPEDLFGGLPEPERKALERPLR